MSSYFKSRSLAVLAALVVAGLLIGVFQGRSLRTGEPFFLQDAVRVILYPLNSGVRWLFSAGEVAVEAVKPRSSLLRENAELRKKIHDLTMENERLKAAAFENVALKRTLNLRQTQKRQDMIAAQVIGRQQSNWFNTALLGKGSASGVQKAAAVVNHLGLAGQIVEVDPYTSLVVALTDDHSAVGGRVQRSRAAGIIQGQASDYLVFVHLPKNADIVPGDVVVSSGDGKVVPPGIPIGRVEKVERNSVAGTTSALVRPSVLFDELEYVFIVNPTAAK